MSQRQIGMNAQASLGLITQLLRADPLLSNEIVS